MARFKVWLEDIPRDIPAHEWVTGQGEHCLGATEGDGLDLMKRPKTATNEELVRWISNGVKKGLTYERILELILGKAGLANERSLDKRIKRLERRGVAIPKTAGQLRTLAAGQHRESAVPDGSRSEENQFVTKQESGSPGSAQGRRAEQVPKDGKRGKKSGRETPTTPRRRAQSQRPRSRGRSQRRGA